VAEQVWTIRDYAAGDETQIVDLFERVFKKTMGPSESAAHWRWEYAENPVGPLTIKLIWHADRLVGQYAVSPRRLWMRGEERLAALSIDTMTDPEYGRQGIFSGSAEACYTTMTERGFGFVYGFPNANSIAGFERRLSWKMVMATPVLVKALDVGAFVADKIGQPALAPALTSVSRLLSRGPGLLDSLQSKLRAQVTGDGSPEPAVHPCEQFGAWADDLWLRCRDQHQLWVVRDHAFLSWRYDQRPESDYRRLRVEVDGETVGYAVTTLSERDQGTVCFIMDLMVDLAVPGALSALLQAIEARARAQHCAFVSAMVGPGSPMRATLLRNAYLPLPERLFPQELHFGGRALGPLQASERATLEAAHAWQLAWGDVDVL